MPINQMHPGGRKRGAVHELLIQRLQAYGDEAIRIVDHAIVCKAEYFKVAATGILHATRCTCFGQITGGIVATREGLATVTARATVDATGDADVAHHARAETMKGRKEDGFLSPMTLCLLITNVDVPGARVLERDDRGLMGLIGRARPKYPLLPERMHFELGPFPLKSCLVIDHAGFKPHGILDGRRVTDPTGAERHSRRQAIHVVQALREFGGRGFQNVQLAATGSRAGVRETRRIRRVHVLTEDDAMSGRRFDDAVAWRSGMLDVGFVRYERMEVHDVPNRTLLPEKVDGLLVAGRCISATHVAASAGKSMGNCVATGHAAGLAAAIAAAKGCAPRELDVRELQDSLAADDVDLERRNSEM